MSQVYDNCDNTSVNLNIAAIGLCAGTTFRKNVRLFYNVFDGQVSATDQR